MSIEFSTTRHGWSYLARLDDASHQVTGNDRLMPGSGTKDSTTRRQRGANAHATGNTGRFAARKRPERDDVQCDNCCTLRSTNSCN